ncbi:multidrug effflux MFS transporter [Oceanibium sediminis]|uniref:multidrug effflux MFS transporter n=1 Tax=Oceanibium sediminis TaxID=2026339 RepID=UPI000DD2C44A|nr:multidrug effflux MFS transporter [Oceanibium sediminis]
MTISSAPPPRQRAVWLDRTTPPKVLTLVLIAGLGALSMNVFLPSLPSMAAYYNADYAVVQLAVSAYLGATALVQLVIGPLSDRYGRRPVMLGAVAIFSFATLGCIFSPSIEMFLVFRMIQSVVAAGIVLSRAIVRDMVPADKAASMIGYVTMGMSLVPMVSPMIGGVLDQWLGWKATFFFMLAFGLAVGWLVWNDLGESNDQRSDSFGAQFRAYPELVRSRRFWGYTLVASFASGSFFAFLGGGPYVATVVLGMNPAELGLYFGFIALGYMIGNYVSGRFSEAFGLNAMMFYGSAVAMLGLIAGITLFLLGFAHPISLFGSILFVGLGNGMTLPNANAGIVSVRPHLAGSASGLGGAMMIGGGAGLAALTGMLLTPERGVWPLLLMMLASSIAAIAMAGYVIHVARKVSAEAAG